MFGYCWVGAWQWKEDMLPGYVDRRRLLFWGLVLVAVVLNYYPVNLLLGAELYIGNALVLVVASLLGWRAGLLSFIVCSIPAWIGGQEFTYFVFHAAEVVAVALLMRSKRLNVLLADVAFLLVIAIPFYLLMPYLGYIDHFGVYPVTALSMVFNSIFCASLAGAILYFPIVWIVPEIESRVRVSINYILFTTVSFIFICASMIYVGIESRMFLRRQAEQINASLTHRISNVEQIFDLWLEPYEKGFAALYGELAALPDNGSATDITNIMQRYSTMLGAVDSIRYYDGDEKLIASYAHKKAGENNEDAALSSYVGEYRKALSSKEAVLGDVFIGDSVYDAKLRYIVPVIKGDKTQGVIVAVLDLLSLGYALVDPWADSIGRIFLLDDKERVVVTTSSYYDILSRYEETPETCVEYSGFDRGVCCFAGVDHFSIKPFYRKSWRQDILRARKTLQPSGWEAVALVPVTTLTYSYKKNYERNLLVILCVLFAAGVLLFLFGRLLFIPLHKLAGISRKLTTDVGDNFDVLNWPQTKIYELRVLVEGMRQTLQAKQKNIAELKASNKALSRRENDLAITLESIADGVIVADANAGIISMNPVACRLTGWDSKEALGRQVSEVFNIINARNREKLPCPVSCLLKNISCDYSVCNYRDVQVLLISRTGAEFYISNNISPVYDESGRMHGVVMVFRDVTRMHEDEQQMLQAQKMEAIGQLAGGVAHDFNNMLGGILGFAELVHARVEDDPQLSEFTGTIISTAERAAKLTNQLLSFSRRGKLFSTVFDLHEIILEANDILRRSIDKRISIKMTLNASKSMINGDPSQLQNVFINFGLNARDAMKNGGQYSVMTRNLTIKSSDDIGFDNEMAAGEYIVIEVSDTGEGMDEDTLNKIFEPFFTTKAVGCGTGLGLSAAYGAVISHKGAINVFSNPGEGTAFCVFLPVCEKDELSELMLDDFEQELGQGTVLVIDDEEIMCAIVKNILVNNGYEVVTALSPEEGISAYKQKRSLISLVLMDMIMPQMSGEECSRVLKEINPDVKIVLCSGFTRDNIDVNDIAGSYNGFLEKPFRGSQLIKTVARVLNE